MSEAHNAPQGEAAPQEAPQTEQQAPEEAPAQEYSESSQESAPETQEELSNAVDQAVEEGASEKEVRDMIREFELKVNGKKVKKKIDLTDEEALKRELQKAYAFQDKSQEVSELKKLYSQELERLKQDPWEVLQELEMNDDQLDELAAKRLQARLEQEQKSPEEREREQLQKEVEQYRKQLEQEKRRAEEAKMQQLAAEAESELTEQIEQAFDAHQSLPRNEKTVARIADAMLWAHENGFQDATVEDVIPAVEAQIKEEFNSLLDSLGDEGVEQYFGKKRLDRFRQKRLKDMRDKQKSLRKKEHETAKSAKSSDKPKKKIPMRDFFDSLG